MLEANIERIREMARKHEESNWRFRSFLKGIDLSPDEVDAIVHAIHQDVSKQIDCTRCANCCRAIAPSLDLQDIDRLCRRVNLSKEDFHARYLDQDEEEPSHWNFRSRPCPFLQNNRCSVYEDRPCDCRSYPHIQKEGFVFRLAGVCSNVEVCPIVFHVYERLKDELWHRPWGDY